VIFKIIGGKVQVNSGSNQSLPPPPPQTTENN